jgi:hypothetical protein
MPRKPSSVREPIQVYLDGRDRALLDALAKREKLPRSEILRMGLRRLGAGGSRGAAGGLASLTGSLAGTSAPEDLAERHDEYLAAAPGKRRRGTR